MKIKVGKFYITIWQYRASWRWGLVKYAFIWRWEMNFGPITIGKLR